MSDKLVKSALFKASFPNYTLMHDFKMPEFAFIGRSNVGKSSLINMLTGRKELALTSSKPGKTRQIVCFELNQNWMLIDLPGYGYAKLSKKERETMSNMVNGYLKNRKELFCLFLLIDMRIPPQAVDIDFINWCGSNEIPFVIVFTKADKVKLPDRESAIIQIHEKLAENWEQMPPHFICSALSGEGRETILNFISSAVMN
jgi:GTP-binding protein